jgi:cyclase
VAGCGGSASDDVRVKTFAIAVLVTVCATAGACQARPRVDAAPASAPGIVPIVIETERGDIRVSLDSGRAPATVSNFLRYIDGGFFANGRFHRTVTADNQPRDSVRIEVIQGSTRSVPRDSAFAPIELERTSVTGLRHADGTISMARAGPNTATSSFFITIGAQPSLDEGGKRNADGLGFAAFGHVTDGMNVVRAIQQSPRSEQNLTPPIGIRGVRRVFPKRTADPRQRGVPLSAFPRLVPLAPNVYGYEEIRQPGFTTVSLIVIGTTGVLIADGQGSTAATQTMLDRIKTITPLPVKWYVVGSDHGDHTAGNSVLPAGIDYIVHPASLAQLKRDSAGAPATRRVIVPSAAMRGDAVTIDVGTMKVDVRFLGRAHTGGDLSVYLPSTRILFMSEAYLNRVFPAMRSAYPSEWIRTIDRALAMNVSRYIPGHGFIEEPAASREELVAFREALRAVIAEVTRLRALGLSADDAVKQAQWGPYASWFLAEQQAPVAVRKVYEELAGTLK